MEFSLFAEASRDHEAEAALRRTARVRSLVAEEIFPFLALARSEAEYGHRKALAAASLYALAARAGAPVAEVEACADRLYQTLAATRQGHRTASGLACANCGHHSVDHAEGLQCSACGCADFTPRAKEARRVVADGGDGPFS